MCQKNGIPTIIFKRKIFDLPDAACGQLRQRYIKGIGSFNSGETIHVNI
jgi:adenine C2-methylase RlmN of 23S rRNA A2503 and tRNA A37